MTTVKRTYGRRRELSPFSDAENDTPPTSQHSQGFDSTPKQVLAGLTKHDIHSDNDSDEDISLPNAANAAQLGTSRIGPFDLEDEDEDIVIDARLQPSLSVSQIMKDEDSETDEEEESAYDRLRREILTKKSTAQGTNLEKAQPSQPSPNVPITGFLAPDSLSGDERLRNSTNRAQTQEQDIPPNDVQVEPHRSLLKTINQEEVRRRLPTIDPEGLQTSGSDSEDIEAEIRMLSRKRAPRRHASKKAIEDMHKETERMQRGMTLVPSAQVKTKLKMSDFLSKIGFSKTAEAVADISATSERTGSHTGVTDLHEQSLPSSQIQIPVVQDFLQDPLPFTSAFAENLEESDDEDIELPGVVAMLSSQVDSHAAPALIQNGLDQEIALHKDVVLDSDSDSDDLSVRHKSHKLLFKKRNFEQIRRDRRAAKFVAMARPDSPTKLEARAEKLRKAELLAQVARQAKADRQAREASMKALGVNVISAEQRQKEALEIENLVDRARKQADELRELERSEDRRKKSEAEGFNIDSATDEEWQADMMQQSESEADTDLDEKSGSGEEDHSEVENSTTSKLRLDGKLKRIDSILSERHSSDEEDVDLLPRRVPSKKSRAARILDDDDFSDADKENALPSVPHDAFESGLTQFFEPTQIMRVSRSPRGDFSATQFLEDDTRFGHDSMQLLRDGDSLSLDIARPMETSSLQLHRLHEPYDPIEHQEIVRSSQPEFDTDFRATQFSVFDPPSPDEPVVPLQLASATQFTQATEIDCAGSLQDPVNLEADFINTSSLSLLVKPKLNRLRKANGGEKPSDGKMSGEKRANAFRQRRELMNEEQMRRSRKAFVDDRAVESDDEYAGLGGVSDEELEDTAEVTAELAAMIDHDIVDEDEEGQRRIAAFHAQKDLEDDEKLINSLMNDINNGGLRRKRGAGLLDMDDSEDEEAEEARYKARQAQIRARLLEAHNLTSLAANPKTKAFIDALEDRPVSANFIEIAGEDDLIPDLIPETQGEGYGQDAIDTPQMEREDTQVDDATMSGPKLDSREKMQPPTQPAKRPTKKRTPADIRSELSFLRDDEDDESQSTQELDHTFVPLLKRERSSLSIVDRAQLSRENSQTWRDPRLESQGESMYSELASARKVDSRDTSGPQTVVVSRGTHMASRMATKAVNYHARAARAQKEGKNTKDVKKTKRNKMKETEIRSKKQDVLKLLA